MKKLLTALAAALTMTSLVACTSIESTKVNGAEFSTNNGSEAVAVVQVTTLGLSAILHLITIADASLDQVVNKALVAEAKMNAGNKVELLSAFEAPKKGIFMLSGGIIGVPMASATGIAVK